MLQRTVTALVTSALLGAALLIAPAPSTAASGTASSTYAIGASQDSNCAILENHTLYCWGYNSSGVRGNGSFGFVPFHIPTQEVTQSTQWSHVIDGSDDHICAIKTDSTLWCWGNNSDGQLGLGDGAPGSSATPRQAIPGEKWRTGAAGRKFTCAIKLDATLWCWGRNNYGQLGDGTTSSHFFDAVQVNGGGKWKSVSAAEDFTCGIKEDETLWCWGRNDEGQLGNGTTTYRSSPTKVPGVWTAVDTGGGDEQPAVVCAKKSDATLWCWGRREQGTGQLGLGEGVAQSATPRRVAGAWGAFGVGRWGTCAIRNTQLWCWGDGYEGNLGRGAGDSHADSGLPLLVQGGGAWASISRGADHGCFVQTDGTVWCLGQNYGSIPLRISLRGKVLKVIQDDSCDRSSRGRERCRPTR